MIRTFAVAGVLLLAAGCSARPKGEPLPEDATIGALVAKLAPAVPCDRPVDSQKDRSVRAECDGGRAFVTVWPDAASVRAELARLAGQGVPNDYLVGDTWFAGASDADGLAQLRTYIGGRIEHVGPTPTG